VDLHFLREQRGAELAGDTELRRLAVETKAKELRLVRAADVTLVVSAVEQALLQREAPGARIEVLSNVHAPPASCVGFAARRDICFVGGFQHPPNVDAVRWFAQEIWPLIAAALPDARFHVIGSRVPEEIAAFAAERVLVHGYVPDLTPYLDGCRISVAPLRYGAGVKGKVNQAMAHGQPVVATAIAVEGMQLEAGREALVANEPAAFAAAVVKLYQSPALWQQLAEAGRANVARHFSFDAAAAALKRILPI
jgi:glycosyltransferase involved in cell wall biosynthesis